MHISGFDPSTLLRSGPTEGVTRQIIIRAVCSFVFKRFTNSDGEMTPGGVCGTSVSTIVDYASPYLPFVFSVFTAPRNFTVHFFQLTFVFSAQMTGQKKIINVKQLQKVAEKTACLQYSWPL